MFERIDHVQRDLRRLRGVIRRMVDEVSTEAPSI
jgi:hypothetical protein